VAWGLAGSPVRAQAPPERPVVRAAGTTTNLFATFDLARAADGFEVEHPGAWTVEAVTVLRYGSDAVPVEERRKGPGRLVVRTRRPVRGPVDVVLRVTVGDRPGRERTWTIAPFSSGPGDGAIDVRAARRIEQQVRFEPAGRGGEAASENHVLDFSEGGPLLLRPEAVPELGPRSSFTAELWIATTGLDEVVLSTWTGDESQAYPLELFVDPSGRLRSYFGRPGEHRALLSRDPLADGRWHHVAVAYHAERRVLRLLVDGAPVDSLTDAALPRSTEGRAVAVGGRRPGPAGLRPAEAPAPVGTDDGGGEAPAGTAMRYTGRIDALQIWGTARTPAQIQAGMRGASAPAPEEAAPEEAASEAGRRASGPARLALDFEAGAGEDGRFGNAATAPRTGRGPVAGWSGTLRRERARLPVRTGLQDLSASTDDQAVRLEWRAPSDRVDAFIVERSSSPRNFTPLARLRPDEARRGPGRYAFTDEATSGRVLYYRVRQRYRDGTTHLSGTLKVGLGADTTSAAATLIGNFPNPFRETTTVTYEVEASLPVTITIWDLAGHRVAQLAEGVHAPGYYERTFRAADLPSGTYFVRLETPTGLQSHRMVLLR
jgi:hypothetical protein